MALCWNCCTRPVLPSWNLCSDRAVTELFYVKSHSLLFCRMWRKRCHVWGKKYTRYQSLIWEFPLWGCRLPAAFHVGRFSCQLLKIVLYEGCTNLCFLWCKLVPVCPLIAVCRWRSLEMPGMWGQHCCWAAPPQDCQWSLAHLLFPVGKASAFKPSLCCSTGWELVVKYQHELGIPTVISVPDLFRAHLCCTPGTASSPESSWHCLAAWLRWRKWDTDKVQIKALIYWWWQKPWVTCLSSAAFQSSAQAICTACYFFIVW